ncbi:hypothetical protein EMIT043CA1_60373 [Pseudomonas brassicacearum]
MTWFIELAEHYPLLAEAKSYLQATRNRFSHLLRRRCGPTSRRMT